MQESAAGYFTYQPPDSTLAIHLSLDAVDGILSEVMTGFGAIPRRGAEVGGLLLGKRVDDSIWIDEFAMVACEHRHGPSYLLSDRDRELFSEAFDHHRARSAYPVGVFRSNTRDSNSISDEDKEWFGKYFPAPSGTFLLVRPYASKTSTASFLVYRDGVLEDNGADSFPFVRWELDGGTPPQRRALGESRPRRRSTPALEESQEAPPESPIVAGPVSSTGSEPVALALAGVTPEPAHLASGPGEPQRGRRGWFWIPMSFLFLVLGVLLGFQAASTFYPRQTSVDAATFALGLSARARDEAVHVTWNRESPAILAAQHGRLEIRDGQYLKIVDLDSGALRTGSVMYPPLSASIQLRLELTIQGNTAVTETLDWSKSPVAATAP